MIQLENVNFTYNNSDKVCQLQLALVNVFFYVVNPDVEKRPLRECLMD